MSIYGSGNETSIHVDVHARHFAVVSGGAVLAMFAGNDGGAPGLRRMCSALRRCPAIRTERRQA